VGREAPGCGSAEFAKLHSAAPRQKEKENSEHYEKAEKEPVRIYKKSEF
jgi:hypothetical protein